MSRCEVCGVNLDNDNKTCSRACFRKFMSVLNNPNTPSESDPTPDEVLRRARVIREFNDRNKVTGVNAAIRKSDMYWFKD